MSALERIAHYQQRRDEAPDKELARELAEREDLDGIREIVAGLGHANARVRSDCIKVLYEIGYLKPGLVAPYAGEFVRLLSSRNNRLVWGGMIALSTVAGIAADEIYPYVAKIRRAMEEGSVITVDAGVLALARLAATSEERRAALFPYLLEHLRSCRPKEAPQHAEKTLEAVNVGNRDEFIAVVRRRLEHATPAQAARLRRVIRQAENAV